MAAYATTEQLQAHLGASATLPADAERLLTRASELLEYFTLGRIDVNDTTDADVAARATCAQVEFWMETDESHAILGIEGGKDTAIGSLRFNNPSQLAPRARMILTTAGLLNRTIRIAAPRRNPALAESFFDPQKNPQRR
jgi:hypothetical protein